MSLRGRLSPYPYYSWWAYLRWRYSPYWRGYRAGLSAREDAHQHYLKLQEYIE